MKTTSKSIGSAGIESPRRDSRGAFASVDWRVVATALFVSAGCFFGARLGDWLRFPGQGNAVVFLPYSLLAAALIFSPPRRWWIYLLASLAGHFPANLSHFPAGWVLLSQLANYTKALIAAVAIRQFNHGPRLNSLGRMAVFFVFGVFIAPAAAALIGAATVVHYDPANTFWLTWRAWFLSNALTAVMLLPALLIGIEDWRKWLRSGSIARWFEFILLEISLLVVSYLTLVLPDQSFTALPPKLYCLLPILLWASVRFGTGGAGMAVLTVGAMAIMGAITGRGPFAASTEDLLSLQLFVIILSMPKLFLAALIEERSDMAEKLRGREERIGLAAETASFALWTIGFGHGESWMSEKGRELFGLAPDEQLSREVFLEHVHPEDRAAVINAVDRARAASEAFEIEFRLFRPDGETRWLHARGRYLRNDRGEAGELIGAGIDVTARRQAEDATRDLAHASRLAIVGELTASIAHEINQPLGAILSNADAAEMLLEKPNPRLDEVRQILTDIRKDDLRASEVIRRMRTLLRKRDVEMLPLDLNEAVSEILRLIESDARRRGVAMDAGLDPGLPVVQGDKVHLQQVLLNLAVNGMEAMADVPEAKRRLAVRTRRTPDGAVEVLVTDTGHGIPPDRLPRLFESFFTTKKEGMGLGLSIVRSIIEAHHGRIWAENNAAGGTTFRFTLPAKKLAPMPVTK